MKRSRSTCSLGELASVRALASKLGFRMRVDVRRGSFVIESWAGADLFESAEIDRVWEWLQ